MRLRNGGTLLAHDLYVNRSCDEVLLSRLLAREYCLIPAPRAIGKSSLLVRTVHRLRERKVCCVIIGVDGIGAQPSLAALCSSMMSLICRALELPPAAPVDPAQSWSRQWTDFLCDCVRAIDPAPLVVLLDEIELLRLIGPTALDEFAMALRYLHNARAERLELERVTFAVFGTLFPAELLRDEWLTPFNVGEVIPIEDFTETELQAFLPALAVLPWDAKELLHAVNGWTSGHPRMTQRILLRLLNAPRPEPAKESLSTWVDQVAQTVFLRGGGNIDLSLERLAEWLRAHEHDALVKEMLDSYQRLLLREEIPERAQCSVQAALWMAGLARYETRPTGKVLVIRNRAIALSINLEWMTNLRAETQLSRSLAKWEQADRCIDLLLEGSSLRQVAEWARGASALSTKEREYLLLSEEWEHARLVQENLRLSTRFSAQTANQKRITTRLQVGLFALGSLGCLMASGWIYSIRHQARGSAYVAKDRSELSQEADPAPEEANPALATFPTPLAKALADFMKSPPTTKLASKQNLVREFESAATSQRKFQVHPRAKVQAAALLPDGSRLIVGGRDGSMSLYGAASGALLDSRALPAAGPVMQLGVGYQGSRIFATHASQKMTIWSLNDGNVTLTEEAVPESLANEKEYIWPFALASQAPVMLTPFSDGSMVHWNYRQNSSTWRRGILRAQLPQAALSAHGRWIVAIGDSGQAQLFDTRAKADRARTLPGVGVMQSACFSSDEQRLVTFSSNLNQKDGASIEWRLWETEPARLVKSGSLRGQGLPIGEFDANGSVLAVFVTGAPTIFLLDGRTGSSRKSPNLASGQSLYGGAFINDSMLFVVANQSGEVRVIDTESGNLDMFFYRPTTKLDIFNLSENNEYALSGSAGGDLWIHPITDSSLRKAACTLLGDNERQSPELKRGCAL